MFRRRGIALSIYIALLRGINVSGHRLIKMADLRALCERLGLHRVQTYIQSGNILFESEEEAGVLGSRLEEGIRETFGFEVPVVLRTAAELGRVIQDCPFPAEGLVEGEYVHVSLLAEAPSQEGIDRLRAVSVAPDEFRLVGREIYILFRQSSHKSKLSNALIEQKLRVPATLRNWQTMSKLLELARDMAVSDGL